MASILSSIRNSRRYRMSSLFSSTRTHLAIEPNPNFPDIIEYTGEFGPELVLFLPFVNWLSASGLLKSRRIKTYKGMRSFYDGFECIEIIEKDEARRYVPPEERRDCPVKNEHDFDQIDRSPFLLFPNLREKFLAVRLPDAIEARLAGKPFLIIHNKHNNEWGEGPVNHIGLETLDRMLSSLKHSFNILYIRHGLATRQEGFVDDHNEVLSFPDRDVVDRHPEVMVFDDLFDQAIQQGGTDDVNLFKNILYSRCYKFITSQGGGAHQIACFSGSMIVILHRDGRENEMAYSRGYYGFISNPAPIRLICRNEGELVEALDVMEGAVMLDDRIIPDARHAELIRRLSPWAPGRGDVITPERWAS